MGMVATTTACMPNTFCSFRIPIPTFSPVVSPSPPALRNKSPFRTLLPPLLAKPKKNCRDHHPPTIIEEASLDGDDDDVVVLDDVIEDDYEGEEYLDEEEGASEVHVGDGGEGGGISLAGTWWDKEVLAIAEEVSTSFDRNLKIYAFRTLWNSIIQVRIEKKSNKSCSPSMEDIEAFSTVYRSRLDEAEAAKLVPDNLSLEHWHEHPHCVNSFPTGENRGRIGVCVHNFTFDGAKVSSPGVERIVRVPHDLDRFKDRPMYVKYVREQEVDGSSSLSGIDGIFSLISFNTETSTCTWGLADVRKNREKAGKGRPLSKKQREWRLDTSFDSLRLVRLYSEM